jgi:hypothetical protein
MEAEIRDIEEVPPATPIPVNEFDCLLCVMQRRNHTIYPPEVEITATTPKIQLQCGHVFHTHCFIKRMMFSEMEAIDQNCPDEECNATIVPEETVRFYRGNRNRRDGGRTIINLWNDQYTFIPKLKQIFKNYIYGDIQISGELLFEEIGKYIEYNLPVLNTKKPLFVIRIK